MAEDTQHPAQQTRRTWWVIAGTGAAGVVIAVGAAVWLLLLDGDDEAQAKGRCQGASYELGVERDGDEDDRVTASLEVLADQPDEEWTVRLTSNGRTVLDRTVRADSEAEVDVDAFLGRGDAARTVVARFGPVGSDDTCRKSVTLG